MAFSIGAISANVTADDSGFNATMSNVHKQGQQVSSDIAQQFNRVGDAFVSAGKKLTAGITAPLTALAGVSVKAFDTQIQAEKRLESALAATGEEVRSNMRDFKEFASGLQEITTVGDESTLQMIQTAKSMGLTNDQAKRAAKNSIALAKAMDMNEQSAIRYAAALEQGQVTMLSRYLPGLREIEDMSERAAKAQELLSDMFGAATAEAEAGLGPLKQIKNTLGDFSEEVGEIVLNRLQPLINDLRTTVNWFKNLDQQSKELVVTVGGLAAAIGPAALGLGWAIKLTIPAVKTLTKSVRALTSAMVANPYLAVAAAIAAIGAKAYTTEQAIASFHDEIRKTLDTADNWETVNKKIADVENRMQELADAAQLVGVSPEQNKEFVELRKQLERLVDMRDRLAGEEIRVNMQMDALKDARNLMAFINTDISEIVATAQQADIARPFVELKGVTDKIIPSLDQVQQGFQELSAQEIMTSPITNVPEKMFPPGSLGFIQQSLQNLREQLRKATNPEVIERLRQKIRGLNNEMQGSTDKAVDLGQALQSSVTSAITDLSETIGNALTGDAGVEGFFNNILLAANDFANKFGKLLIAAGVAALAFESLLENPVAAIIAGSALVATTTAVRNLLKDGPKSSQKFHSGGIVPGNGEKQVTAKGGEGIFTKGQMKAMGGMMQNGGNKTKKLELNISGELTGQGDQLRAVINESRFIELS